MVQGTSLFSCLELPRRLLQAGLQVATQEAALCSPEWFQADSTIPVCSLELESFGARLTFFGAWWVHFFPRSTHQQLRDHSASTGWVQLAKGEAEMLALHI